jgi:hypothetical protein
VPRREAARRVRGKNEHYLPPEDSDREMVAPHPALAIARRRRA